MLTLNHYHYVNELVWCSVMHLYSLYLDSEYLNIMNSNVLLKITLVVAWNTDEENLPFI